MAISKKLKLYPNEKAVVLPFKKTPKGNRYAITNHGRVISFTDKPTNGNFLSPSTISDYPGISLRSNAINKSFLIHRLVAQYFVKQPTRQHQYVIHLNYQRDDNHYKNLKWVTLKGRGDHQKNNPNYQYKGNTKLSLKDVEFIKKKLLTGKTTLKTLAQKFGVSDMQIHRIKTGENWGHVTIQ
jgi:hypothetical protein